MKYAFTLIELLVVISIISLLSSIVLSTLNTARDQATFSKVEQQMKQIVTVAKAQYAETGVWAPDGGTTSSPFNAKYLSTWPKPPCDDWYYNWDNWIGPPNGSSEQVQLSLTGTINNVAICLENCPVNGVELSAYKVTRGGKLNCGVD